jgi:hypothetical protein
VRVDLREVGDPVAVVAGGVVLRLHRLVLEAGREPDRRGAEVLDVVEPLPEAGEVAAVVEALVRRVEPRHHPVGPEPARVVRRIAVLEAVRHDEVELLVGDRRAQRVARVAGKVVLGGQRSNRRCQRGCDDYDDERDERTHASHDGPPPAV